MLSTVSFKLKLVILLLIPIVALALLGVSSVRGTDRLSEELITSLHEQDYKALEMILNAENNMHSALVAAHTLVYTDGSNPDFNQWKGLFVEKTQLAKTQAEAARTIAEKYNESFKKYQHPSSKRTIYENFSDFNSNFRVWNELTEQAIAKMQDVPIDERAEAMAMIRDADSSFEATVGSVIEISQMLKMKTNDVIATTRAERESGRDTTHMMIGGTLLLIAGLSFVLLRATSRSLRGTVAIAERVADGDLRATELPPISRDDIGKLTLATHNMAGSLRGLIHQITEMADNVTISSERVAESTAEIAQSTEQIAGELEQVSSGSEMTGQGTQEMNRALLELAAGIQRIAETTTVVAAKSQESAAEAAQGNVAIRNAIRQMHSIRLATDSSAGQVQQLGEQSQAIEQIVEVIAGLAAQTNLLALNAAIEAARAGEQGRGFAVVAEEVRKLADQSQSFTAQIGDLLGQVRTQTQQTIEAMDNVTREVHAGIEAVDSAGNAFEHILEAAQVVADQIQDITAASEEMSAGSEQVTASVDELARIAQETSESAETSSSAVERQTLAMRELRELSEELAKLAHELNGVLTRFQV